MASASAAPVAESVVMGGCVRGTSVEVGEFVVVTAARFVCFGVEGGSIVGEKRVRDGRVERGGCVVGEEGSAASAVAIQYSPSWEMEIRTVWPSVSLISLSLWARSLSMVDVLCVGASCCDDAEAEAEAEAPVGDDGAGREGVSLLRASHTAFRSSVPSASRILGFVAFQRE